MKFLSFFVLFFSFFLFGLSGQIKQVWAEKSFVQAKKSKPKILKKNLGLKRTKKVQSNSKVVTEKEVYRVKKGENLYRIAKKFGLSVEELMKANQLSGPDLKVGQKLIIPRKKQVAQREFSLRAENPKLGVPTPENTKTEERIAQPLDNKEFPNYIEHRVAKGETLFSIAQKYGVSVGEILTVNGLENLTLAEGMVIKIPLPPSAEGFGKERALEKSEKIEKYKPKEEKAKQEEPSQEIPKKEPAKMEKTSYEPSEKRIYHTVKKGETLNKIAKLYQTTPEEIKRLNHLKNSRLKPGKRLLVKIERGGEVKISFLNPSYSFSSSESSSTFYLIHQVKEGETLYRLSLIYGVPIEEIKRINGLQDNILLVGQTLKIPVEREGSIPQGLVSPKEIYKTEEEPLPKKFSTFTLGKEVKNALKEKFLEISQQFVGTRYRFGGNGEAGLDCSAFVQRVYGEFGIKLPRSSYEQYKVGKEVDLSELIPGDLVFFKTSRRAPITHVGIYLGENQFVHVSSRRKGLAIDSLDDPYFRARFVGAKRVLNGEIIRYFVEYRQNKEKEWEAKVGKEKSPPTPARPILLEEQIPETIH